MPALTVAVPRSGSTTTDLGRSITDTRSPVVSATVLNEWPVPSARSRLLAATTCCSSSTLAGRWRRAAEKVTLRAQLVSASVMCGFLSSRLSSEGRDDPGEAIEAARVVEVGQPHDDLRG